MRAVQNAAGAGLPPAARGENPSSRPASAAGCSRRHGHSRAARSPLPGCAWAAYHLHTHVCNPLGGFRTTFRLCTAVGSTLGLSGALSGATCRRRRRGYSDSVPLWSAWPPFCIYLPEVAAAAPLQQAAEVAEGSGIAHGGCRAEGCGCGLLQDGPLVAACRQRSRQRGAL